MLTSALVVLVAVATAPPAHAHAAPLDVTGVEVFRATVHGHPRALVRVTVRHRGSGSGAHRGKVDLVLRVRGRRDRVHMRIARALAAPDSVMEYRARLTGAQQRKLFRGVRASAGPMMKATATVDHIVDGGTTATVRKAVATPARFGAGFPPAPVTLTGDGGATILVRWVVSVAPGPRFSANIASVGPVPVCNAQQPTVVVGPIAPFGGPPLGGYVQPWNTNFEFDTNWTLPGNTGAPYTGHVSGGVSSAAFPVGSTASATVLLSGPVGAGCSRTWSTGTVVRR